jgi:hypothetical protein
LRSSKGATTNASAAHAQVSGATVGVCATGLALVVPTR